MTPLSVTLLVGLCRPSAAELLQISPQSAHRWKQGQRLAGVLAISPSINIAGSDTRARLGAPTANTHLSLFLLFYILTYTFLFRVLLHRFSRTPWSDPGQTVVGQIISRERLSSRREWLSSRREWRSKTAPFSLLSFQFHFPRKICLSSFLPASFCCAIQTYILHIQPSTLLNSYSTRYLLLVVFIICFLLLLCARTIYQFITKEKRQVQRMARESCCDAFRRIFGLSGSKNYSSAAFSTEEDPEGEQQEKEEALREVNVLRNDLNRNRGFRTNKIRTAKYTWITAFPLSLLTQFHKVSNVYFLFVMSITLIPGASPINPMSSIIPFSLVLGAGIIKDLWVDVKRQRADKKANQSPVHVLRNGKFVEVASSKVYPGDVMLYRVGEEIKADCVILNTSLPEGLLYIDTANLDGETNAKTRRAKPETVDALSTVEDIEELAFRCNGLPLTRSDLSKYDHDDAAGPITVEPGPQPTRATPIPLTGGRDWSNSTEDSHLPPDSRRSSHHFSRRAPDKDGQKDNGGGERDANAVGGIVIIGSAPNADLSNWYGKMRLPNGQSVALGIEQFLPRGCVLRNTEWILAAVVYTGKETKILMNYNARREKYSIVTRHLNYLNICLFAINQIMMLTLSGMSIWFKKKSLKQYATKTSHSMWYMQYQLAQYRDVVLYWWRYLTNFVLLSYLIPLSLYVTLEFNKAMQLLMMASDRRMAVLDEFSGAMRLAKPKTAELNAELAHVRYIFTDKTGTLTENLMTYVGGFVAGAPHDECSNPGGVGLQLRDDLYARKSVAKKIHVPDTLLRPNDSSGRYVRVKETGPQDREREELEFGSTRFASHKSVLEEVSEDELELNPRFRYLRALSLCHSVLCFFVKDVEEAGEEEEEVPEEDKVNAGCCVGCCGSDNDASAEEHAKENLPGAVELEGGGLSTRPPGESDVGLPSHSRMASMQGSMGNPVGPWEREEYAVTPNGSTTGMHSRRQGMHVASVSLDSRTLRPNNLSSERQRAIRSPDSPASRDGEQITGRMSPSGALAPQFPMFGSESPRRTHFRDPGGSGVLGTFNSPARNSVQHYPSTSGVIPGSTTHQRHLSTSRLHGHTNSASWYYHQYNSSMAHARLEASMGSVHLAPLAQLIDRSKFYEGQSLDEVALVNAARENAFSLLDRSTRRIRVKMLDTVRCYTIVAENEFTPQRKLMSILLKRDYKGDREDPNATSHLGRSYHRTSQSAANSANNSPFHSCSTSGVNVSDVVGDTTKMVADKGDERGPMTRDASDDEDDAEESLRGSSKHHKYLLLVKGADNSMLDIVNKANAENARLQGPLMHNLEESAKSGLRTLVLGQRFVSEEEVAEWLPMLERAMCAMGDRSARLHEAYAKIERDVDLVGSTCVEDKLQEGVPETLQFFLRASIVLWMLTGDKRETAVTIALTSGLATFENLDCVSHLNAEEVDPDAAGCTPLAKDAAPMKECSGTQLPQRPPCSKAEIVERQMEETENLIREKELLFREAAVVLVVDGRTLDVIFADEKLSKQFFDISTRCRSAVCCRMTPMQKAQIVRMFKRHTDLVTLAVGDGANDVSMIQESHIGVGIMGLEGSQAELSSDYAIPKFRFLRRLLMVHGRFSLYRDTHCVLYSIYKNMFLTVSMICYTTYSGYSGQAFVESWYLSMFSVVFCSIQPLLVGIIDKDMDDELAESVPELYAAISREHMFFSVPYIVKWLLDGFVEGAFCYFTVVELFGYPDNLYKGKSGCLYDYSTLFFTALVLVSNLRVIFHLVYQNLLVSGIMLVEMIFLVVVEFVFTSFHSFAGSNWVVFIAEEVYSTSMFYVYILAAVGICLLYTIASTMYIQLFAPWRNAPFAVMAARQSPYEQEFEETKRKLLIEYDQRVQYQAECEHEGDQRCTFVYCGLADVGEQRAIEPTSKTSEEAHHFLSIASLRCAWATIGLGAAYLCSVLRNGLVSAAALSLSFPLFPEISTAPLFKHSRTLNEQPCLSISLFIYCSSCVRAKSPSLERHEQPNNFLVVFSPPPYTCSSLLLGTTLFYYYYYYFSIQHNRISQRTVQERQRHHRIVSQYSLVLNKAPYSRCIKSIASPYQACVSPTGVPLESAAPCILSLPSSNAALRVLAAHCRYHGPPLSVAQQHAPQLAGPAPAPAPAPGSSAALGPSPAPAPAPAAPGRALMSKARRARLAAAVALAERQYNAEPSPGAALIHSERLQELRAEEALLAASLQRLQAERELATARHECERDLETFRRGVAEREEVVAHLIAEGHAPKLAAPSDVEEASPEPAELGAVEEKGAPHTAHSPSPLGIPATCDAEAAAAAARQSRRGTKVAPDTGGRQRRRQPSKAKGRTMKPKSKPKAKSKSKPAQRACKASKRRSSTSINFLLFISLLLFAIAEL
eukprot:gene11995-8265_t